MSVRRTAPLRLLYSILYLSAPADLALAGAPPQVALQCATTGIVGPLRVSAENPRYFTNDCGRAIYMTGSHTWNNFIDMDDEYPPEDEPFSYDAYLDFLDAHGHNFIRLWAWEGWFPDNANRYARRVWASPQPWNRVGPGTDITGLPRFDLTDWRSSYFERLADRVERAQERGIYVAIMLFEGWELQFAPGRLAHAFNEANNVNGVHFGSDLTDVHTLSVPEITGIQEEYVRRVIDAVNDYDNVMYEISNESGPDSTAWQYHMIDYVRSYESTKPKQHPVGMSAQYNGLAADLTNSSADWISPGANAYRSDPPVNDGPKVILIDNDHLGGSSFGDRFWVWQSFFRGLNVIFMDRYDPPDSVTSGPIRNGPEIRRAMGQARALAEGVDLLHMTPQTGLSSTSYALAGEDEYLVYDEDGGGFELDLSASAGEFSVEWFRPETDETLPDGTVVGGAPLAFTAPFSGESVLHLSTVPEPTGTSGALMALATLALLRTGRRPGTPSI